MDQKEPYKIFFPYERHMPRPYCRPRLGGTLRRYLVPVRAHLTAGGEEGTSPSSVSPLSLSLIRCVLDTSTVRSGAAWLG